MDDPTPTPRAGDHPPSPRRPGPPAADGPAADRAAREPLYRALSDLLRVVQFRDRERICCHDVSVTQCYALEEVLRRGPLTLNQLAGELYLDKSTASRVVTALVDKGYLDRRTHPDDGRAVLLEATAAGERLHAAIEADLLEETARLAAGLPAATRDAAVERLARLARAAAARVERGDGCCRLR